MKNWVSKFVRLSLPRFRISLSSATRKWKFAASTSVCAPENLAVEVVTGSKYGLVQEDCAEPFKRGGMSYRFSGKASSGCDQDGVRRNEQIRARELRVIGPEGEQLGILGRNEAIAMAKEHFVLICGSRRYGRSAGLS